MEIVKEKALWVPIGLTLALAAAGLVLGAVAIKNVSAPLIIHFDQFHGVDFVGSVADFWGIWLGGLAVIVLNAALSTVLYRRERFLAYLLLAGNALIALLMLVLAAVVVGAN
ncbi:hypothetical protein M1432_01730 [Patescibacteria group bacterium]|nr:hypothetical protein [Patescibacteria group bacterium]